MLLLVWSESFAQDLLLSDPQKVSHKVEEYELLGKTSEGILIHKWGDKYNVLEAYNPDNLRMKWSKEMELRDKKAVVLKIIPLPDELVIIYSLKVKKEVSVYARKVAFDLTPLGEDVLIDRKIKKFGASGFDYFVDVSKNRLFYNILRHDDSFNGLSNIQCFVLNSNLEIIGDRDFAVADEKLKLQETFINTNGHIFLGFAWQTKNLVANKSQFESLELIHFNPFNDQEDVVKMDNLDYELNDVKFEADSRNNRVVVAGFYSEKKADAANGYYYAFMDLATKTISQQHFEPFSDDFLKKVNTANNLKTLKKKQIYDLEVARLLLRNDGGALLIGEAVYTSKENVTRSSFESYYSRQVVQVTNYYHNDLVLLSVNPNGSLFWDNVLKKKQYSEEDAGYFSSVGVMNNRMSLHLLFNEEISFNTNLNNCVLTHQGEYKISSLVNVKELNLMVAPRYGKQLSETEILIPAFNSRNEFLLAKITF